MFQVWALQPTVTAWQELASRFQEKKVESESFPSNEHNCFQKLHLPTMYKMRLNKLEKFFMAGVFSEPFLDLPTM